MREPLIPRSDWLADSLNALFLRRVWRPPAEVLPEQGSGEAAAEDRPDVEVSSGICDECGNSSTGKYCQICSDPKRERATIMVVSDPAAILQAEARGHRDVYHVHYPGAGGIDQVPFSVSGSRLLERLRRYRAKHVILKLEGDAEMQDQQRKLHEQLVELRYNVSLPQNETSGTVTDTASNVNEATQERIRKA